MSWIEGTAAVTSGLIVAITTSHAEHWLNLNGWRPHIQRKGQTGKRDKARNKRIASPRARVEHIFASLAQMSGKTIHSIGLARAQFDLPIKSAVYNLKS